MMALLKNKPFEVQRLEEERSKDNRKIFTVSLNLEEYAQLIEDMKILKQPKESTALKQLWQVGRNVLHGPEMGLLLRSVLKNDTNNRRVGIMDAETEISANVTQKTENSNTIA